ncbi:MAG: hypothetical protein JW757_12305 [Anaerolineales bacterium]|nr:hypothetical protein [Anaerolineales bacterium]
MKSDIRTILRDIQAAARIGHIESLWAALDQLQAIPQVGGNHPLDETFLNQVILPVGKAVSRTRTSKSALRPLVNHPLAAYRAVAGAALVTRFLDGTDQTSPKDLNGLAQDPREDVRQAVLLAAIQNADANPEKVDELYIAWQQSGATRVQALAYQILPYLPGEAALEKVYAFRESLQDHPAEVRKTLSNVLCTLGANGQSQAVFEILTYWADQDEPDYNAVARSLSKPWAACCPEQSLEILTRLAEKAGAKKRIRKALQNLSRNGAEEQVKDVLENWRNAENPNLRAAGNDEKLNL